MRVDLYNVLDYRTGETIVTRPGPEWAEKWFGHCWHVLLRADYQRVLVDEAERLGVTLRLGCDVESADYRDDGPIVTLADGEIVMADVIVGADGKNQMAFRFDAVSCFGSTGTDEMFSGVTSTMRGQVLGYERQPTATGDMGYRTTVPRAQLERLNDSSLDSILRKAESWMWWGPEAHVMLYPVANCEVFNLALM